MTKEYRLEQKVRLIESLWKIAFIDGVLDMNTITGTKNCRTFTCASCRFYYGKEPSRAR
ncbi:MAG: hypothetical protein WC856_04970 [Methylococcaceae bacterium]